MGHRQNMTDKQKLQWDIDSYKSRLKSNKGHNYQYYTEELEENLFKKGYQWYNILVYPSNPNREDVTIATKIESYAKEIVGRLRKEGFYARIICGVKKTVQKEKHFSIIYKKK